MQAGEAARIFTGGVVPRGTDTVVIQENTAREGDAVIVRQPAASGSNMRARRPRFRARPCRCSRKGRRLTDRDLTLAAAMNHATVPVHRRPKVAILATGDELVPPGSTPEPGQIVYSNGFALSRWRAPKAPR